MYVQQHIGVISHKNLFITLPILPVSKLNFVTKMRLISRLMRAKFEGNPITRLHFMAVFKSVQKEGKEEEKKKNK